MKDIEFDTLEDVKSYFKSNDICKQYLTYVRWGNAVSCPYCGSEKVYITNRGYTCASKLCLKKFTCISGTIFEGTKIPLLKWFSAFYIITTSKNRISSIHMAEILEITQKTSWFLMHRIRKVLKDNKRDHIYVGIYNTSYKPDDTSYVRSIAQSFTETYKIMSDKHKPLYSNELYFVYNNKEKSNTEKFKISFSNILNSRLKLEDLINK